MRHVSTIFEGTTDGKMWPVGFARYTKRCYRMGSETLFPDHALFRGVAGSPKVMSMVALTAVAARVFVER
jgi:hypothetical protein